MVVLKSPRIITRRTQAGAALLALRNGELLPRLSPQRHSGATASQNCFWR